MLDQFIDGYKINGEQKYWYSVDPKTIQNLSSTGRHQECLQACQQLLQNEPENPLPWKHAGKSLLALRQFKKAQQCLTKAHQLDNYDPETIKDIGNIFNAVKNDAEAIRLYKAALSIDKNYAPAINNLGSIAGKMETCLLQSSYSKSLRSRSIIRSYRMNLGMIYETLYELENALESYTYLRIGLLFNKTNAF